VTGLAILVLVVGAALLAALHLELNLLAPAPRGGLRVLMYHRVGDHPARDTVAAEELERQIAWLRERGHALIGLRDLLAHRERGAPLPERPVLLTFDDGTADQLEVLLPVLRRCRAPAGLFAISSYVGKVLPYGGAPQRFLSSAELRQLAGAGVEIGLHSHSHRSMAGMAPAEVEEEVAASLAFFAAEGVPVEPVLAYPFGAYPRAPGAEQQAFFAALRRAGVRLAFRIGNRVNPLPLDTDYEVQRIGIRRADRLWSFAIKVRKGRRKAFA